MLPAGDETLALWRELGEWWTEEPAREIHRYLDQAGVPREVIAALPTLPDLQRNGDWPVARLERMYHDKVRWAVSTETYVQPKRGTNSCRDGPAALHFMSGYSFGRSCMIAAAIPGYEQCLDYSALLLADSFSLAGAVEFSKTCKSLEIKPLIGATFELSQGGRLVLVAQNRSGYRNLSTLITRCHLDEPRLYPLCDWERIERYSDGLLCLTGGDGGLLNRSLTGGDRESAEQDLERLIVLFGRKRLFIEIERSYLPWEISVNRQLLDLAEHKRLTAVAGGPIMHRYPQDFPAQDMMVCIDTLCTIEEVIGRKPLRDPSQPQIRHAPARGLNAERHLRSVEALSALFAHRPDLVVNTKKLADLCEQDVLPKRTKLPAFCSDEPKLLRELVLTRAAKFPDTPAERVGRRRILNYELKRIIDLNFAGHFLVAWDMCNWAREQGIVHSGRGSVVDSAVAYCLGLSRIDAFKHDLHFDRFLPDSKEGRKRPDIDIDFEARRRDDVRNYLVSKYGDDHVAIVGAVGTYGTRGIIREVGKVMGIPQESLDYLTKRLHGSVSPDRLEEELARKPELRDSNIPRERFRWVFKLAESMMETPRNLRAHSSGVVISREPIACTVPVVYSGAEGVKIIQWDKRSCKNYFDKFDVLCLRGNDVLSDTQERVRLLDPGFSVEELANEDENVFAAMRRGQLIGIPQSASPAMRQAHTRLQTASLHDAGIVQAAIRPGVGGAVKLNELIDRRRGRAEYIPSHPRLGEIMNRTYGVVVFQEQVDQLLQEFGRFDSEEAEEIRDDIQRKRREEDVKRLRERVVDRIQANGFSEAIANEVYELVAVFKGYGFAEGHALSFADVSIRSVWCQQNYPAEYFAAILDAQPAGYYGPATLVNEARARGVKILPPNVNRSFLKFSVEAIRSEDEPVMGVPNGGIRVSLSQIMSLSKTTAERIVEERSKGSYGSFFDFVARVRPASNELESLILCGALDELHENRRVLLWAVPKAIQYGLSFLQTSSLAVSIPEPTLPRGVRDFNKGEMAIYERRILDLDVERHLMAFERERVSAKGAITAAEASNLPSKSKAIVVGNPIRLRFPPTGSGKLVMFFDLEDESGLLNVTCFDEVYRRDGHKVICNPYVTLRGEAQDRDGHIAFLASHIYPYRAQLENYKIAEEPLPLATADFLMK